MIASVKNKERVELTLLMSYKVSEMSYLSHVHLF